MLTTCGLTHTGGDEKDEFGERCLHDRISQAPATIDSVIQPNLLKGKMDMSVSGRMIQTSLFGPTLELRRTISSTLGSSVIRIKDEVSNLGNNIAPHMLLYHMNFGWPLVDEGTKIIWEGKLHSRGECEMDDKIFNPNYKYKTCTAPSEAFQGEGSAVGIIDTDSDSEGYSECGLFNATIGLELMLRYKKEQFPWMANWQHFAQNEYVTALEPCTAPPIGQKAARDKNMLVFIKPNETKVYEMEITVKEVLI